MELGGIEPPSARWSPNLLRPFPTSQLTAAEPAGRPAPKGPLPGLSPASAVFHAVSGLSLRSSTASVAGLQWSGPVRHCWSRFLSYRLKNQAARANSLLAVLCCAPINESEQLGSHARLPDPNVETSQPRGCAAKGSRSCAPARPRWPLGELPTRISPNINAVHSFRALPKLCRNLVWRRATVRPVVVARPTETALTGMTTMEGSWSSSPIARTHTDTT